MEENLPLIIQLLSGAVGGNIAGRLFKNLDLGTVGNSICRNPGRRNRRMGSWALSAWERQVRASPQSWVALPEAV